MERKVISQLNLIFWSLPFFCCPFIVSRKCVFRLLIVPLGAVKPAHMQIQLIPPSVVNAPETLYIAQLTSAPYSIKALSRSILWSLTHRCSAVKFLLSLAFMQRVNNALLPDSMPNDISGGGLF